MQLFSDKMKVQEPLIQQGCVDHDLPKLKRLLPKWPSILTSDAVRR